MDSSNFAHLGNLLGALTDTHQTAKTHPHQKPHQSATCLVRVYALRTPRTANNKTTDIHICQAHFHVGPPLAACVWISCGVSLGISAEL